MLPALLKVEVVTFLKKIIVRNLCIFLNVGKAITSLYSYIAFLEKDFMKIRSAFLNAIADYMLSRLNKQKYTVIVGILARRQMNASLGALVNSVIRMNECSQHS